MIGDSADFFVQFVPCVYGANWRKGEMGGELGPVDSSVGFVGDLEREKVKFY